MRITHGRGITDGTLTKLVHALPRSISICDALEQFTGVHTGTSEKHKTCVNVLKQDMPGMGACLLAASTSTVC